MPDSSRQWVVGRAVLVLSAVLTILAFGVATRQGSASLKAEAAHEQQVRDFIAAFNARDLDRMLGSVDEKIQWLSVEGAKVGVEAEGKAALKASMESYFKSCPTCRSSLEWAQSAGSRVTALERASWASKSGPLSQISLSVYEFSDRGIARVYYFPAERDKQAARKQ